MFTELKERCDVLNAIAQEYLDGLPFIDNETLAKSIWAKVWDTLPKHPCGDCDWERWDEMPELFEIADCGVPYTQLPKNGSLHYAIGFAITAQEANLRALYEHLINGAEKRVFKMLADL